MSASAAAITAPSASFGYTEPGRPKEELEIVACRAPPSIICDAPSLNLINKIIKATEFNLRLLDLYTHWT
jgi:hypothetical protein